MYQTGKSVNYNAIFVKMGILFLLLIVAVSPLFGEVRSARGRTLASIDDIVTNRFAKFDVGSILTSPLIEVTIRNNAEESKILFELKIDFGGDWEKEYVEIGILMTISANETVVFTNTKMLEYIDKIHGFASSDTLVTTVGIDSIDDIGNLTGVPEGKYKIAITASEVFLDEAGEIITSSTDELLTEEVEFKVVTIGDISSISTPTIDNLKLSFTVPEIPVYDDAWDVSTSSTTIRITGSGLDYSGTQNHAKSVAGSSAIKGYPSDTVNGYVEYDVKSVQFRAGGTYTVEILFKDWNNAQITLPKTRGFSFPNPSLDISLDTTEPLQPTFSWEFSGTEYSEWVKEYRLYINGSHEVTTTNDSYNLSAGLLPGTAYTWYVIPYNKDGTPFFSASDAPTGTFTTSSHDELQVVIDQPATGDLLFVGETYTFEASAVFYDGASLSSAQWSIGSKVLSGLSVDYTPNMRYPGNALSVRVNVTDSLGLNVSSGTQSVTVLDPKVAIAGSNTRETGVNTEITFTITNEQDVDTFSWFVDGDQEGTGESFTHAFSASGQYTVHVEGTTDSSDMKGEEKTVQSESVTVTVIGLAPDVSIPTPNTGALLPVGSTVKITANIENQNPIKSIVWSIDGTDQTGSGNTFSFTPSSAGTSTVSITVTDEYDKKAEASVQIIAFIPSITITNISNGDVFPLNTEFSPDITASNAKSITWFINASEVGSSSINFLDYGVGDYELYASAVWDIVDNNGNPTEFGKESTKITFKVVDTAPPEVSIDFPNDGIVLKTAETYTFSASATSDSSISNSWWMIDGSRYNPSTTGTVSYTPKQGMTKKLINVSYHAKNENGIEGSESLQVQIADPGVYLSPPSLLTVPVGEPVTVQAVAVDAELYWLIDGSEIDSWDKIFTTTGKHTVQAGWRLTAAGSSGSEREFSGLSDTVNFEVFSANPPILSGFKPDSGFVREKIGEVVSFSMTAVSDNGDTTVFWEVTSDGSLVTENSGSTSSAYRFSNAGTYIVKATVSDTYGYSTARTWTAKIIDPAISILTPESGSSYGLGSVPEPDIQTQDLSSWFLSLDGENPVADDFNWVSIAVGSYKLTAIGEYIVTSSSDPATLESDPVNFEVKDLTPPEFTLEGISSGDRIIAGLQYHFIAAPAGSESFQWFKNGTLIKTGAQYDYTPGAADGETQITCRATLNGIISEQTFSVEVIDPFIEMYLPEPLRNTDISIYPVLPSGIDIPLRYESRDIDIVEWNIDGSTYSGQFVQFEPGLHAIDIVGKAANVRLPDATYGDYRAMSGIDGMERFYIGPPVISSLEVSNVTRLYTNQPLSISVETEGDEIIDSLTYLIDGSVFAQTSSPIATTMEIPNPLPGNHTISVEVTDGFGRTASEEISVLVHKPLSISILQPVNGTRISPDAEVSAEVEVLSGQAAKITWSIDGKSVSSSDFLTGSLGQMTPGSHKIEVAVTDNAGSTVANSVTVEVQSDFLLNLIAPAGAIEIIVGNTLTCRVGVEKVGTSDVDLKDAAEHINWYIDGRDTGETGLTFIYTGTAAGSFSVYAEYEKDGMERSTSEQTITVRDLAVPKINYPAQGEKIIYTIGQTIPLRAEGEPGASFSWMLGSSVIAMGKESSFNPNGLTGSQQIKLVTSAYGRTKEKLVTVKLTLNNPPEISLTAPATQYTGDPLAWTASAFDVDDTDDPEITILLDGVSLIGSQQHRILNEEDKGKHTLKAIAKDSQGVTSTKQVTIEIQSGILDIEIQSPIEGDAYLKGYEIPLIATLGTTNGESSEEGTFTWTVQYLDNPAAGTQIFTGKKSGFSPNETGEITVLCEYTNADGVLRGSKQLAIFVESEPVKLGIYWPHGSVVNSEQDLAPELTGMPENGESSSVNWAMNGSPIDTIDGLQAPKVPGEYTLSVQYTSEGKSPSRAEVQFIVNGWPGITIVTPGERAQITVGTPIILSADITDDQPFSGAVTWIKQDGSIIGTGNPFVLEDAEAGEWNISGKAIDKYGAESTKTVNINVYHPVADVLPTINGGSTTYLVKEGNDPLAANVSFTGGINPKAIWELRQGDNSINRTGKDINFSYADIEKFSAASAVVTLVLVDDVHGDGSEQEMFRQDFPLLLTRQAVVEILSPVAGDAVWVGDNVSVTIAATGLSRPVIAAAINGTAVEGVWEQFEDQNVYSALLLSSGLLTKEGVYELVIKVSGNGTSLEIPYTLNVYEQRKGIFIDNPPTEINLEGDPVSVSAITVGLDSIESIQWRTDMFPDPVASGDDLDLNTVGLAPGDHTIIAEAVSGGEVIAQTAFLVKVFGAMELDVIPEEELLIIRKGASVLLQANARDRDGTVIDGEQISWTSHLDGLLGTGTALELGNLETLSIGEHILTIEAVGSYDSRIAILQRLLINPVEGTDASEEDDEEESDDDDTEGPGGDPPGPPPQDNFSPGDRIPDPPPPPLPRFGPGGGPPDPGLEDMFNDMFGGGMPGGGFGGGAPGFGGGPF
ncbi:MAG: hypothetical protein KAQ69_03530 [Spirochaetales bacterium]|nr:hypothetical protein [Spirochaetales bacterium]